MLAGKGAKRWSFPSQFRDSFSARSAFLASTLTFVTQNARVFLVCSHQKSRVANDKTIGRNMVIKIWRMPAVESLLTESEASIFRYSGETFPFLDILGK